MLIVVPIHVDSERVVHADRSIVCVADYVPVYESAMKLRVFLGLHTHHECTIKQFQLGYRSLSTRPADITNS